MMLLSYQRKHLRAYVNTWLGTALLVTVALWAGLFMWNAATGENAIVQAFNAAVAKHTELP